MFKFCSESDSHGGVVVEHDDDQVLNPYLVYKVRISFPQVNHMFSVPCIGTFHSTIVMMAILWHRIGDNTVKGQAAAAAAAASKFGFGKSPQAEKRRAKRLAAKDPANLAAVAAESKAAGAGTKRQRGAATARNRE